MRRRERAFAWLAVLGSIIGAAGLILLSIFDTKRHTSLHRVFLLVFMLGVALSALFSIIEYRWLAKDFHGSRRLRKAYLLKGVIAGALIALAIAFAGALYGKSQTSTDAGAVLEWVIAFGYTLYLLTFVYDLRLAKGRHRGELSRDRLLAAQQQHPRGSIGTANGYAPSTATYGTQGGPPMTQTGGYGYNHA
jgi:amino acid transporter